MKIKRYMGKTVQEAMQKVKDELGREAIIINTRKVKKRGIAGWFSKPLIEVVATIDSYEKTRQNPASTFTIPIQQENVQKSLYKEKPIEDYSQESNTFYKDKSYARDIENEFTEMKTMINKVYSLVKNEDESFTEIVKKYLLRLKEQDIEDEIILMLKESIKNELTIEKQEDEKQVRDFIYKELLELFPEKGTNSKSDSKVMIFVGPTGVGKTTTLAKLAALFSLHENKKVAFITSDTYRIAAVEQLKVFSDIIGVDTSVIYSSSEFTSAVDNYKDKDIIMVDTAGRSHKDKYQLMELKSLINTYPDSNIYLVISATTKMKDCKDIIKSYSFIKDYNLLFTKIDETSSMGILLNASYMTEKPLSYITIGQNVPDDIEVADKNKIICSLLGENAYEGSS